MSALVAGQVAANAKIAADPAGAARSANSALAKDLGKGLAPDVLTASFQETTFTNDPGMASLRDQVNKAVQLGLLKPLDITGLFDPGPLNKALVASGQPQIAS